MKQLNYYDFPPGNNIWRKPVRFLFLNLERIAVLSVYFIIGFLLYQFGLFSWHPTIPNVAFVILILVLSIYSILPAPSNPNSLMLAEVVLRNFKMRKWQGFHASLKVNPMEKEDR